MFGGTIWFQEKEKKTISQKSLQEMKPIVKEFFDFLRLSLRNGATLSQFRLAIETKFGSDQSLWPQGTDSTSSPQKKEKAVKRKREEKSNDDPTLEKRQHR